MTTTHLLEILAAIPQSKGKNKSPDISCYLNTNYSHKFSNREWNDLNKLQDYETITIKLADKSKSVILF